MFRLATLHQFATGLPRNTRQQNQSEFWYQFWTHSTAWLPTAISTDQSQL